MLTPLDKKIPPKEDLACQVGQSEPFGEIIESSLTEWKIHCWRWDATPAFASPVIVTRDALTLFGIVFHVQTGSIEPGRSPFAYQKTEEELMRDQPHIFSLLQTTCRCAVIGYAEHEKNYHQIPSHPPKIHAFVRLASDEELKRIFSGTAYAYMLFNNETLAPLHRELMLALFKQLRGKKLLTDAHIRECIHVFSMALRHDYRTLKMFLQRLEAMLSQTE